MKLYSIFFMFLITLSFYPSLPHLHHVPCLKQLALAAILPKILYLLRNNNNNFLVYLFDFGDKEVTPLIWNITKNILHESKNADNALWRDTIILHTNFYRLCVAFNFLSMSKKYNKQYSTIGLTWLNQTLADYLFMKKFSSLDQPLMSILNDRRYDSSYKSDKLIRALSSNILLAFHAALKDTIVMQAKNNKSVKALNLLNDPWFNSDFTTIECLHTGISDSLLAMFYESMLKKIECLQSENNLVGLFKYYYATKYLFRKSKDKIASAIIL